MAHSTIQRARAQLLERGRPAGAELLAGVAQLTAEHVPALLALADDVRSHYCGNEIAVEVLYNAKKGGCSEDCNFCSQSARYATGVGSIIELNDAQVAYTSAAAQVVQARYSLSIARAQLLAALGRT